MNDRRSALPSLGDGVAAALCYARKGWPVFPVYEVGSGLTGCSCSDAGCNSPAKHPRTPHGLKDASTDPLIIVEWWKRWPEANVGVGTGRPSRLGVLDVDPRHGGDESLHDLQAQHGALPDTVTAQTGGGCLHYFFTLQNGAVTRNSASRLAPGLDWRGDGGYVVVPPSKHASGRPYVWTCDGHPDDMAFAPVPRWLLQLVMQPTQEAPRGDEAARQIREGERNITLASMAGTMRRRGMSPDAIEAALLTDNERRCAPPLHVEEVRRIAASVGRYRPEEAASFASDVSVAAEWPPPLAQEAFHGLAGDIVRAMEPHTEADSAALLIQALVAFGNVVGRGAHFVAEADRHFLNLFAVVVAETSKRRKGSSWGRVRSLFETLDPAWIEDRVQSGLSSGEGLIWAVRDEITKSEPVRDKKEVVGYQEIIVDPGVEDKRLLVVESEYASTLRVVAREGNTLSPTMRTAWDTGNLRTLTKNSPACATGAHISVIGHVTKSELLRYLDATEAGNGFGNHHLWVCARRSKVLPEGGGDVAPQADLVLRLRQAVEFASTVGEMRRDEDARDVWWRIYEQLSEGKPGLLGAMIARAEAQAMRIACIYALLDRSPVVQREHLLGALAVWDYCEASARYIFGEALGDPIADQLLRALHHALDGLTQTQIRDHFGRHTKGHVIDRALGALLERGLAHVDSQQTGGRPVERWHATKATKATEESRGEGL